MAASMQRLDTSNSSNPDEGLHSAGGPLHRTPGASVDKSHSFRESHGSALGGSSSSHSELPPLTSVLFLEPIAFIDAKSNRQVELRRAMNAATGQQSDDPNLQPKALENSSPEEIKRVKSILSENVHRAWERQRHLSEAVIKLDRFQQSRKRNKTDSGAHDRVSQPVPGPRSAASTGQATAKGGSRSVPSSGEASKGGEKIKSGIINKRMRTSLADARPEGRAINWIVQRSSGVQERERDTTRPSGILSSPVDLTEKTPVIGSEGWEKAKMKGRRSATLKPEASGMGSVNGCGDRDRDREQKGNAQYHRAGGDSRSRPSEGHGFRSGLVHGTTVVQKGGSAVQVNGSSIRGSSRTELEGASYTVGKLERVEMTERERLNGKPGAKPISRGEGRQVSPGITPKAKGARAPRSNSVAGGNQTGHMSHSLSFTEVREKPSVITPPKPQVSSGPVNKKRPASSRSSSPPVASWGSSRHQKMARARRVNPILPVGTFVPAKEDANGTGGGEPPLLDGSASAVTASARLNPPVTSGGSNLAKRLSGGHGVPPSKAQTERLFISVGTVESDDCMEEGHKERLHKSFKNEVVVGKHKMSGMIQKLGTVVVPTRKEMVLAQEESGGGDGVRRQGRTGRGSVTPRAVAVSSPSGKVVASPVVSKPTRSARAAMESKPAGPGRPVTKKVVSDRKSVGRPRRLLGNSVSVLSGEENDDLQRLSEAVQQAVDFSAAACSSSYWTQVEAYFAHVTSDELSFLHKDMAGAGDSNTVIHYPLGTAVKSTSLDRTVTENEGKSLKNLREQTEMELHFMRGRSGRRDKVFPLSQLLLSALISERVGSDSQIVSDETCVDRDSDSPLPPSSHSEIDYDRRDAEGESDVDNGGYSECSPISGDQGNPLWSDNQDVIIADKSFHQLGRVDWVNGVEDCVRDDQPGSVSQIGISSLDWEEQYQKMSLDDRLQLELSSIGLLPVQPRDVNELDEDEISEELRRLQNDLTNKVLINKERLSKLESAVLGRRETEDRAREKLAMDRFVELAYKKKTGGRFTKGAAGKAARAAALEFAKRVLARVRDFESGHSCITDPALRDKLFCVPPSVVESIPVAALNGAKEGGNERNPERMNSDCTGSIDFSYLKDEARERAEEREIFLEDVSGYTSTRDVNTLSSNSNGFGGIKGKRSERDRDGKEKVGSAPARSGQGNAKGERKNKTKPRQKTGSLLKSMQGTVPKTADSHPAGKGSRASIQAHAAAAERHSDLRRDEAVMPSLPGLPEPQGGVEGAFDTFSLPGIEDMSMAQADMGSWLDFDVDDPMQQTDDFLNMGLDVPMDDLSALNLM